MMDFLTSWEEEIARETKEAWDRASRIGFSNYTGKPCPRCGRYRCYWCNDGRARCEKCSFVSRQFLVRIPDE